MGPGLVFDLRKYAVRDGPGIRTAVFLKGCPLRCAWCHNPEGIPARIELLPRGDRCVGCGSCAKACPLGLDPSPRGGIVAGGEACRVPGGECPSFGACADACPAEAIQRVGREMDVGELMRRILEDRPFYDESGGGVTFTGGEPLAQADFLLDALRGCRAEEIPSAVDTSGWAPTAVMRAVAALADLLLFDLKLMDPVRHLAATGVPVGPILDNLRLVAELRIDRGGASAALALRLPVVPGVNDLDGDLEAAADFIASLPRRPGDAMNVHLLPYHSSAEGKYRMRGQDYVLAGLGAPAAERMRDIEELFTARGLEARIGG
jgi:pyruvate formate lyase activating enzyme